MNVDHKDFWRRYQTGIEVSVAAGRRLPDKLLGVRDGFVRYFHEALSRPIPISVSARLDDDVAPLPLDDEETLDLARRRAHEVSAMLDDCDLAEVIGSFVVGTESGLAVHGAGERRHFFVRTWTVARALGREAWGSSGAVQLPPELTEGVDDADVPFAVPGTRRGGGMVASLTGGLETRRGATALATFHALSSLFYGVLESSPGRRRAP